MQKGQSTDELDARMISFKAKHEGCIISTNDRALKHEGPKTVRWFRTMATQRGNKTTISVLINRDERVLRNSKDIYGPFQKRFLRLFGEI